MGKPGGEQSGMVWVMKGYCEGTMSPTQSPIVYDGTCTYSKQVVTETGTESKELDVEMWSSSQDYEEGDVVRTANRQRFKCKGWPFYFWCRMSAYQPTQKAGLWSQAWTTDGICAREIWRISFGLISSVIY